MFDIIELILEKIRRRYQISYSDLFYIKDENGDVEFYINKDLIEFIPDICYTFRSDIKTAYDEYGVEYYIVKFRTHDVCCALLSLLYCFQW